ncbi:MAG: hypothetical protein ACUVTM_00250 [Candidatus Bathyarchaeia archaeon]
MSQTSRLKVQIEHGEFKHMIEGEPEEVLKAISHYISEIYPTFDVASRLIYNPDYIELLDYVSNFVNLTSDGRPLLLRSDLSTDEAAGVILLALQVAHRLGKRVGDEAQVDEIAVTIGKAQKTVQNTLTEMCKAGIVERVGKGSYRLTLAGTREMHETLKTMKEGLGENGATHSR